MSPMFPKTQSKWLLCRMWKAFGVYVQLHKYCVKYSISKYILITRYSTQCTPCSCIEKSVGIIMVSNEWNNTMLNALFLNEYRSKFKEIHDGNKSWLLGLRCGIFGIQAPADRPIGEVLFNNFWNIFIFYINSF